MRTPGLSTIVGLSAECFGGIALSANPIEVCRLSCRHGLLVNAEGSNFPGALVAP